MNENPNREYGLFPSSNLDESPAANIHGDDMELPNQVLEISQETETAPVSKEK